MDSNPNSTILPSQLLDGSSFLHRNGSIPSVTPHSDIDTNNFLKAQPTTPTSNDQSKTVSSHSYALRSRSHNSPNQSGSPQLRISTGVLFNVSLYTYVSNLQIIKIFELIFHFLQTHACFLFDSEFHLDILSFYFKNFFILKLILWCLVTCAWRSSCRCLLYFRP